MSGTNGTSGVSGAQTTGSIAGDFRELLEDQGGCCSKSSTSSAGKSDGGGGGSGNFFSGLFNMALGVLTGGASTAISSFASGLFGGKSNNA
jgi:hypothetical protein